MTSIPYASMKRLRSLRARSLKHWQQALLPLFVVAAAAITTSCTPTESTADPEQQQSQIQTRGQSQDQDQIGIVKALYAAFGRGDIAAMEKLIDPEVVWIFHGQEDVIPYAGTFVGWPGVQDFLAKIGSNLEMESFEPDSFYASDNTVIVVGSERATVRQTGGTYAAKWAHIVTVDNDLITRLEEITDSGAQAEAFTPGDPSRGQAYYTTCAGCHGINGEGNPAMHAPTLSRLDPVYLQRQLRNFRELKRGGPADFYGWMMNGRAKALPSDRAIRDVVAFIDELPDNTAGGSSVDGQPRSGKAIYDASCASCHASDGSGIAELNAPNVAGVQDWYLLEQLTKFRTGLRGSNPDDVYGQQMKPSADALADEQAMNDVVAYIATLKTD